MILLGVINTCILAYLTGYYLYIPLKSLRRNGFTFQSGVSLGILYFLMLPLWVAAITGALPVPIDFISTDIPDLVWSRDAGVIFLMLLPIALLPIFFAVKGRIVRSPSRSGSKNARHVNFHFYFFSYIAVAAFIYFFSGLADGGQWYRTKEDFLKSYGLPAVFLQYSMFSLRILLLAELVSSFITRSISFKKMAVFICLVCVMDLYTTGNRIFTLQVAFVVASALLITRQHRKLCILSILFVPLGAAMGMFRWVRAAMYDFSGRGVDGVLAGIQSGLDLAGGVLAKNGYGVIEFISGATESVNVNVYSALIGKFPGEHSYLYGETLLKLIVFAIPRSIWQNKPESITLIAGDLLAPGENASLVTTVFGEFFANFGVFFIIFAPLFIVFAELMVSRLMRRNAASGVVCFVVAFTLVRMPFTDMIISAMVMSFYAFMFRRVSRGVFFRKIRIRALVRREWRRDYFRT